MNEVGKEKSSRSTAESARPDASLRASREASLGTEGLQVSQASGTVPATAPDDARKSAYANSAPETDDEFHASREASLGGATAAKMRAGVLAPEDAGPSRGSQPGDPDPERDWARDAGKD